MKVCRSCAAACLAAILGVARGIPDTPPAQQLSAAEIMQRVAENQDREQSERTGFVYDENIRVISRRGNGKLICDEQTRYTVAPKEKGAERTQVSVSGKYWQKGAYREYNSDPAEDHRTLDQGIVRSFRDELTHDDSKDGVNKDLFPLTSSEQKNLEFELAGLRVVAGRPAYVIRFRPKDRKGYGWAGEAVIDKEEFQPVTVYTGMARKLPFFVRNVLGIDVPGLGFTTQYTRVDNRLWFPSSFGSEFKIHVLHFFNRTLTVSMESKNFRHTNVDAQIRYEPVQ